MFQLLSKATTAQSQIGWKHFMHGMLHSQWRTVQSFHYKYTQKNLNLDEWLSDIIYQVVNYAWISWEFRNSFVHSDNRPENAKPQLLETKVKHLYISSAWYYFYTKEKHTLFRLPLSQRLQYSNTILEMWVDLVETRLRLDRKKRTKLTIARWLENELGQT